MRSCIILLKRMDLKKGRAAGLNTTEGLWFINDLISWLRARDVAVRSSTAMQVRYLSSRLLVIVGCWDSAWNFVCPSWTHRFHNLHTVMRFQPTRAAICDAINHHPSRLKFDLYQSQTLARKHFFFLHKVLEQLFTRQ